jgi:para-aminobenzoate synthetase component 1
VKRSDPAALSPSRLLAGLPGDCAARLLEARGPRGWGSAPAGSAEPSARVLQLLALDPEVEFRGGRAALEAALRWLRPKEGSDPWDRLLVGSLAYELGPELEPAAAVRSFRLPPPVDLAGFRAVYVFDPASRRGSIAGEDGRARDRLGQRLHQACRAGTASDPSPVLARPTDSLGAAAFRSGVEAIRAAIRRGEVYQANLSRCLRFEGVAAKQTRALYARLARSGDAPFAAYLESADRIVLSNSPERFLRVIGRSVETCPIKGTRPRGADPESDRRQADALLASAKDAAEHLMIVDLERNDLGRVCEIGSVRVAELAALRSFASVHHLVSSVQGRLRPDCGALELLAATFPGGSISGAPKLRALQVIAQLEPVARDIYTGAIGYFDAAGGLDLSVAIRTAVLRAGSLHLHVGAGIVADSDPLEEWRETEAKVGAFRELWGFDA